MGIAVGGSDGARDGGLTGLRDGVPLGCVDGGAVGGAEGAADGALVSHPLVVLVHSAHVIVFTHVPGCPLDPGGYDVRMSDVGCTDGFQFVTFAYSVPRGSWRHPRGFWLLSTWHTAMYDVGEREGDTDGDGVLQHFRQSASGCAPCVPGGTRRHSCPPPAELTHIMNVPLGAEVGELVGVDEGGGASGAREGVPVGARLGTGDGT